MFDEVRIFPEVMPRCFAVLFGDTFKNRLTGYSCYDNSNNNVYAVAIDYTNLPLETFLGILRKQLYILGIKPKIAVGHKVTVLLSTDDAADIYLAARQKIDIINKGE